MDGWWLFFVAYFLGSLPFSFWVARWLTGEDIRQHFSGNAGATNAGRVLKEFGSPGVQARAKWLTKGIFLLDVSKGVIAIAFFKELYPHNEWVILGGGAAILGHMFSPFLNFKGGKGVATALGVLGGLIPLVALLSFGIWYLTFVITRVVALGSVIAALCAPFIFYFLDPERFLQEKITTGVLITLSVLIIFKHRSNLKQLFREKQ